MDMGSIISAGIGAAVAGIAGMVDRLVASGRQAARIDSHGDRLDAHEEELKGLDVRFMPRGEIASELSSLKGASERIEGWLKALVLGNRKSHPEG